MHATLEKLSRVKNKVNEIISKKQLKTKPKIVVVTKTFPLNKIIPLLENGHIHYGENKIQEAENKWIDIKNRYKDLQLHMVGKLQSNKAKKAIKLFDYIHACLPIIASPLVEVKRIMDENEMGVIIENYNPKYLADTLNEMLNNAEKRKVWKVNMAQAKQDLNWENEQKKLVEIYSQFL